MSDAKFPRQTAADFHPEVLRLFDQYVHGGIDRRGFLDGAAKFSVGGVSAAALLQSLSPNFAQAQQVPRNDPRIKAEMLEFASPQGYGKARGYLVRPAAASGPLPTVLVVHENRGSQPAHRRHHPPPGARQLHRVRAGCTLPAGRATRATRTRRASCSGNSIRPRRARTSWPRRLSCRGLPAATASSAPWASATVAGSSTSWPPACPTWSAGAPFYGPAPALDKVTGIKASLFVVFAQNDERINATWPPYEAALKAAKVPYEAAVYPGTQHGFNNDTTPRFDEAAAKQAWAKTLALFNRTLRA